MRHTHYETDDATFPADAYRVRGHGGVAWRVYGWETEPDEDTEWSGIENRTGQVVCVMVGDDQRFTFDSGQLQLHRSGYGLRVTRRQEAADHSSRRSAADHLNTVSAIRDQGSGILSAIDRERRRAPLHVVVAVGLVAIGIIVGLEDGTDLGNTRRHRQL